MTIAWGNKVSRIFIFELHLICENLETDPNYLMACMAFETGETFSPSIKNAAGSGAVGLIQFMPSTANALGTTTEDLSLMNAEDQLLYVHQYFRPRRGRLHTLEDVYMAILWPAAIGKPDHYVLFNKRDPAHPKRYIQNAGLDFDHNGLITKAEASLAVRQKLEKGLRPEFALTEG